MVEANPTFTACPFSNSVIAGLRELKAQQFTYEGVAGDEVKSVVATAIAVDSQARSVALNSGETLSYDRLVLAPGIDIRWDALPGYDEAAANRMPHAWKAGEQACFWPTAGGNGGWWPSDFGTGRSLPLPTWSVRTCKPHRDYLSTRKPRSKLIVLDSKDVFSKQRLFQNAWKELYPGPAGMGVAVIGWQGGIRRSNHKHAGH